MSEEATHRVLGFLSDSRRNRWTPTKKLALKALALPRAFCSFQVHALLIQQQTTSMTSS